MNLIKLLKLAVFKGEG